MALLQRARFTTALVACGVGLGLCGVTLAVAGESVRPSPDPLDTLPADLETVQNTPCDPNQVSGANIGAGPGMASGTGCFHVVVVRSTRGETGTELADRVADFYVRRGFVIPSGGNYEPRNYMGTNACKTQLWITSNMMGGVPGSTGTGAIDPNAFQGLDDPSAGLDPGLQPGGAGPSTTGGAVGPATTLAVAGRSAELGAVPQQAAGAPSTTKAAAAPVTAPSTVPGGQPTTTATPGSRPIRPSGTPGGATSTLPGGSRLGSQPGSEVVLSAQVAQSDGLC